MLLLHPVPTSADAGPDLCCTCTRATCTVWWSVVVVKLKYAVACCLSQVAICTALQMMSCPQPEFKGGDS